MIEVCDECDYVILIADLIATLGVMNNDNQRFCLKIWCNNVELPFEFDSDCYFNFLQEGLRVEDKNHIHYLYYDVMEHIRVDKL